MALKRTYGRILFTRKEKKGFSSCALALNVVILLELLSVASDVNGRVFPLVRPRGRGKRWISTPKRWISLKRGGIPSEKVGFPVQGWVSFSKGVFSSGEGGIPTNKGGFPNKKVVFPGARVSGSQNGK